VPVRYLQLVHNVWDPASHTSKAKVLHSFGREDELDRAAIERLIVSLRRMLDPAAALAPTGPTPAAVDGEPGAGLSFVSSKALGATWALDGVWHALGLDSLLRRLLADTRRSDRVERVLFGLIAARAIEPASKLATAAWLSRRTHIAGLTDDPPAVDGEDDGGERPAVGDDECYRAMDWLIEAAPRVEREVFWSLATLLDFEVDLLFFDTTSTYFQTEDGDAPVARDERGYPLPDHDRPGSAAIDERPSDQAADSAGDDAAAQGAAERAVGEDDRQPGRARFRTWGKSKDYRGDLPQIVIGMAVTRAGIPVRVWSWPGNTTDTALIRQARSDLREWTLARVVWVGDRGFTSAANRRELRAGGHGYILGEKLRSGSADAQAALARPGRYQTVADNLQVKEVRIRDDERFVVCFNPEAAERDAALRQVMVGKLEELIAGSDKLTERKRGELAGQLSTMPALRRYLRTTPAGLLRVDKAAIAAEARLDGKYLLRCSDPAMSAEDIALGYKQLLTVERGWRDLKTHLELRPVYHRLEHRIRAHVLLCWLALLLVRIVETKTGRTWAAVREDLQDLQVGVFTGPAGTFTQTSQPTPATKAVLAALDVPAPKKILRLDPAT
jgi:Transposase DDE domain